MFLSSSDDKIAGSFKAALAQLQQFEGSFWRSEASAIFSIIFSEFEAVQPATRRTHSSVRMHGTK